MDSKFISFNSFHLLIVISAEYLQYIFTNVRHKQIEHAGDYI